MNRLSAAPALAALPTLRAVAWSEAVAALLGFAVVAPLAASDGGYWPTAWGWTALGLCWAAVVALLVRQRVRIGAGEWALLVALAALAGWILTSLLWTSSVGRTALEAQRALVYLTAVLAVVLLVRARSYRALLGGTWAAIWLVSTYALATRLFPERLGVFDPIAGYRLSEPLGYWNALGIFAAVGTLLSLGLASRSHNRLTRALAAASLLILLPTVYFTFSRGSWIALGVGVVSAVVLDPRRLQLITTALALAPAPALGVAVAYHSEALTRPTAPLAEASQDGHRLAFALVSLAVLNGLAALVLEVAERRVSIPAVVRTTFSVGLVLLASAGLVSVFIRYGGPITLTERAYDALEKPTPEARDNLNRRLFTLSSRSRVNAWKTAWQDLEEHRLVGSGAGSYELYWARHRPTPTKVRDAHSLYLETLAELGCVGGILLIAALATPAVGALKARRRGMVPAAFGAYSAYLIHAGVDWDWEMTAVTVTALFCGTALVVAARRGDEPPLSRRARAALIAAVLAIAAAAFVGIIGNGALAAGERAAVAGDWQAADDHARKAMTWMPWSSDPWQLAGEVELARGAFTRAQATLRTAVAKDPDDWELWLDLSLASTGRERRAAERRALQLNPLGPELAGLRKRAGVGEAAG